MLMKRALLVESNPATRDHLRKRLHKLGYSVTLANSAQNALDMLSGGALVHFVLVDAQVEGRMDGWDFAEICRTRFPQLGLLVTVGHAPTERDLTRAQALDFPVLQRAALPQADEDEAPLLRRAG